MSNLAGFDFLGFVPYDQAIVDADMAGRSLLDASPKVRQAVRDIYRALVATEAAGVSPPGKVKSRPK